MDAAARQLCYARYLSIWRPVVITRGQHLLYIYAYIYSIGPCTDITAAVNYLFDEIALGGCMMAIADRAEQGYAISIKINVSNPRSCHRVDFAVD